MSTGGEPSAAAPEGTGAPASPNPEPSGDPAGAGTDMRNAGPVDYEALYKQSVQELEGIRGENASLRSDLGRVVTELSGRYDGGAGSERGAQAPQAGAVPAEALDRVFEEFEALGISRDRISELGNALVSQAVNAASGRTAQLIALMRATDTFYAANQDLKGHEVVVNTITDSFLRDPSKHLGRNLSDPKLQQEIATAARQQLNIQVEPSRKPTEEASAAHTLPPAGGGGGGSDSPRRPTPAAPAVEVGTPEQHERDGLEWIQAQNEQRGKALGLGSLAGVAIKR